MTSRTPVFVTGAAILMAVCASLSHGQGASLPFSISSGGAVSLTNGSSLGPLNVGFAKVLPSGGDIIPDGFEVVQFHQDNVLVSETAVPESDLVPNDRLFVEVNGTVNTGVVIANPNSQAATITFGFQDPQIPFRGDVINQGTFTLPPNSQIARFINEAPFNSPAPYFGMMSIVSSVPVGITSLRGLTNERSEFLITPVLVGHPRPGAFASVVTQPSVVAGYIPLVAEGNGWSTDIVV